MLKKNWITSVVFIYHSAWPNRPMHSMQYEKMSPYYDIWLCLIIAQHVTRYHSIIALVLVRPFPEIKPIFYGILTFVTVYITLHNRFLYDIFINFVYYNFDILWWFSVCCMFAKETSSVFTNRTWCSLAWPIMCYVHCYCELWSASEEWNQLPSHTQTNQTHTMLYYTTLKNIRISNSQ